VTHDELLDQVQKMWDVDGIHELYKALRAVVELHKPDEDYGEHCEHCEEVAGDNGAKVSYPCPTIQAIEEQLK
jgi:hypothetical protein